jgi:hypothetical protein
LKLHLSFQSVTHAAALCLCLRFAADCHGNVRTGTVTLQFVQAIVAKPDQFFYYTSPITFPASAGLLLNDVVPGSCAGITPTFAVVTPPTSGSVVVRAERPRTANCPMARPCASLCL